jgi:hypothetical protein
VRRATTRQALCSATRSAVSATSARCHCSDPFSDCRALFSAVLEGRSLQAGHEHASADETRSAEGQGLRSRRAALRSTSERPGDLPHSSLLSALLNVFTYSTMCASTNEKLCVRGKLCDRLTETYELAENYASNGRKTRCVTLTELTEKCALAESYASN